MVGYEINFNRYFYTYEPPRPLATIEADIREVKAPGASAALAYGVHRAQAAAALLSVAPQAAWRHGAGRGLYGHNAVLTEAFRRSLLKLFVERELFDPEVADGCSAIAAPKGDSSARDGRL